MLKDILDTYGKKGVEVLQQSLAKVNSSGKTSESIRYESDETSLQLIGRGYFEALETGRGPRKNSEYSGFDKGLEEWLQERSFRSKVSKTGVKYYMIGSQWFTAKSLAWKINKDGDKLWRQGHGEKVRDVYSKDLEKFVDLLTGAVLAEKFMESKKVVMESLAAV